MPKNNSKYTKAPGAPRRFKSAYIFFSQAKYKEIRQELGDPKVRAAEVSKLVSQAWQALTDEERQPWEQMAKEDRARYEREKAAYQGPWKVEVGQSSPKKQRAASAFIAYSNERRQRVARAYPMASNISAILADMWKREPPHVRQTYHDLQAQKRANMGKQPARGQCQQAQGKTDAGATRATASFLKSKPAATQPVCFNYPIKSEMSTSTSSLEEDASNGSNETLRHIDETGPVDPLEIFRYKIMSDSVMAENHYHHQVGIAPLIWTDEGNFLAAAAALLEPLDYNE